MLNIAWDTLLAALDRHDPLPADPAAADALRQRLGALTVPTPPGQAAPPAGSAAVSGRTFVFAGDSPVDSLHLDLAGPDPVLTLRARGRDYRLAAPFGRWGEPAPWLRVTPDNRGAPSADSPAVASAAWTDDATCVLKAVQYETPYHQTFRLHVRDDTLTLELRDNVAFSANEPKTLVGRAQ